MKKYLVFLLLICASLARARSTVVVVGQGAAAPPPAGEITYVQSNSVGGSNAVELTGVTAGNLIVVFFSQTGTEDTLTASDGTSSLTAVTAGDGTYVAVRFFYLLSANAGDMTYTISGATGSGYFTAAYEFSFSGGNIAYDTENHNLADGDGSITTGNITSATVAVCIAAANSYAGGNLTSQQIGGNAATATLDSLAGEISSWYRIGPVSAGQATATDPGAGYWGAQIVSFNVE